MEYFDGVLERRSWCRVAVGGVDFEMAVMQSHDDFVVAVMPQRGPRLLVV